MNSRLKWRTRSRPSHRPSSRSTGRRRPASGLVHSDGVVVTTIRALGREDGLRVRRHDGQTFDAELVGWDPTTNLAVLRVAGLARRRSHRPATAGARRPSRARGGALVEQRGHRQRRHRVGHRRSAADRPPPRHRSGHPHDGADARRVCRRRLRRHDWRTARDRDGGGHSRPGRGDPDGHRLEDGRHRARARPHEARDISGSRDSRSRLPGINASTAAATRCSSSA